MQTITTLGSFAVVGVLASLVIEYTKNIFGSASPTMRTLYGLGISIIGGAGVYFFPLVPQNILTDIVGMIAAVNTAYVFLVQYLPNAAPTTPSA